MAKEGEGRSLPLFLMPLKMVGHCLKTPPRKLLDINRVIFRFSIGKGPA
jgi:hypothetical protein